MPRLRIPDSAASDNIRRKETSIKGASWNPEHVLGPQLQIPVDINSTAKGLRNTLSFIHLRPRYYEAYFRSHVCCYRFCRRWGCSS